MQQSLDAAQAACRNPHKTHEPLLFGLLRGLLIEKLVPSGSMIDAGANDGDEACLLAVSGRDRLVHALEPLHQNVEHMVRRFGSIASNLKPMLSGLDATDYIMRASLRAVGMRAGDKSQIRLQKLHKVATQWVSVDGKQMLQFNASNNEFPVLCVDTLFTKLLVGERLGLAHLDLEGYELGAIVGAQRIIMQDRPFITVEVFPRSKARDTLKLLNHTETVLNYDSFAVHESCGWPKDCRNLLLVPRERLASLATSATVGALVAACKLYAVTSNNSRRDSCNSSIGVTFASHAQYLRNWRPTATRLE